ncbi:MAG: carboxypeptidase-like regulatory domain-containing protein, partial [Gammaproteobacteria bacterium]
MRVTDPHNSAIPSATISLISRNGERRVLTADSNGTCRFTEVAAGQYFIQGEAPGFDLSAPRSIALTKEGLTEVALPLGVAQVRSTVTVTASGTPQ